MRLAIVTDSTAVIEKAFLEVNPNVYVVPLQILFKDQTFDDGIDLTQNQFFQKLEETSIIPTTSQPSIGKVIELFEELKKDYDQILYITISSKISGTYNSGMLAKNKVEGVEIEVFDSLYTSVIQLMYVKESTRMAKEGKTIYEIVSKLEYLRENSTIYLVVDDLKHLRRTGRINNLGATVGTILKIKPILKFEKGYINLHKKVRTLSKAYLDVISIAKEEQFDENTTIMLAHANAFQNAVKVKRMLEEIYPNHTIEITELSPVISVHTGPNSLGISWLKYR